MFHSTCITICIFYYVSWVASQINYPCYSAFECVGNAISTTANIGGYGYKSISGRNTSITLTSATSVRSIHLPAAFACTDISFIDSYYNVYCRGSNSCRNITGSVGIQTTGKEIRCQGSNSCIYSKLNTQGNSIGCFGDQSCAFSTIQQTTVIYAYAAYSLYYANIDSKYGSSPNTLTINLAGYYSGFGAQITCHPSDLCILNCYGNSCYMTYIDCQAPNNSNCIINKYPNSSTTNDPITELSQFDASSFNLLYASDILTVNNDYQCNQHVEPNNMTFNNYRENYNGFDITAVDNEGPICCRGDAACYRVNISISISGNRTAAADSNIVCSAQGACSGPYQVISNYAGDIFCESQSSCKSEHIIAMHNVYCLAQESCSYADNISYAQNVFCGGYDSCSGLIIKGGYVSDLNVYFFGKSSGTLTDIYCKEDSNCLVLCGTYDACEGAMLHCDGNCILECEQGFLCPEIIGPAPTSAPTLEPTVHPTNVPTESTLNPATSHPTTQTSNPTKNPTTVTDAPIKQLTKEPTAKPSVETDCVASISMIITIIVICALTLSS